MDLDFHHIGVATHDMDPAVRIYEGLGYAATLRITDPIQKVNVVMMNRDGHPTIEILSPAAEDSPIDNVLKKMGATPYHTCYEVPDLDQALADLRKAYFRPISKPVPAVAFDNRRIVFVYNRRVGLVELLERTKIS